MKMVAVIIVVTDTVGGSVFAKGTAEASAGVRVSIDTAVTVRVLGGIIDVDLNVEVAPGTRRVVESTAASEDVCEPIFEIPPRTEDLLQGVWCKNLTISKNENHILPLFRFIWIWLHDLIGAWLGRMPPYFTSCHEHLASRLKGNERHVHRKRILRAATTLWQSRDLLARNMR